MCQSFRTTALTLLSFGSLGLQIFVAPAQESLTLMTLWAGQSVGLRHHADAAELMTELIAALEDIRKSEFVGVS